MMAVRLRVAMVVLWLGLLVLLGSCATPLPPGDARLRSVVRYVGGADPPWQRTDNALGVNVRRGGVEITPRIGMLLEPGDDIRTGADVAVVLQLGAVGEAVVDEQSSVRLGSLEVFFGRVFANLRGLFTVRSETLEAVNDGTRYLFEVSGNRVTRLTVVDGAVTCRPRTGAWGAVRVGPQRALEIDFPGKAAPRVMPADTRGVLARFESIRTAQPAPVRGFCCDAGKVTSSMSNKCGGTFSTLQSVAEYACRPPPPLPNSVWCCVSTNVVREVGAERCPRERSYRSEAEAKNACIIK